MWLLHKNYAVTTELSNPASIVPKCPRSKVWKVRSVLGPECPGSEVSVHCYGYLN